MLSILKTAFINIGVALLFENCITHAPPNIKVVTGTIVIEWNEYCAVE